MAYFSAGKESVPGSCQAKGEYNPINSQNIPRKLVQTSVYYR